MILVGRSDVLVGYEVVYSSTSKRHLRRVLSDMSTLALEWESAKLNHHDVNFALALALGFWDSKHPDNKQKLMRLIKKFRRMGESVRQKER